MYGGDGEYYSNLILAELNFFQCTHHEKLSYSQYCFYIGLFTWRKTYRYKTKKFQCEIYATTVNCKIFLLNYFHNLIYSRGKEGRHIAHARAHKNCMRLNMRDSNYGIIHSFSCWCEELNIRRYIKKLDVCA